MLSSEIQSEAIEICNRNGSDPSLKVIAKIMSILTDKEIKDAKDRFDQYDKTSSHFKLIYYQGIPIPDVNIQVSQWALYRNLAAK